MLYIAAAAGTGNLGGCHPGLVAVAAVAEDVVEIGLL